MPPSPAEPPRDDVSGARILVGDLLAWSDLDETSPPLAALEVVRPLLSDGAERVLLAGPRAARLVSLLPQADRLDVLVRALPDARTAGDLGGIRDGVSLWCGGLDDFARQPGTAGGFDVVVALGGPESLLGPDSTGLGVGEVTALLARLLRPRGVLVLDLANELGLDDLLSTGAPDPQAADAAWHVGADGFDRRRLYAAERDPLLAASGLEPLATYAALPSLADHRVLVLDDETTESLAAQVISRGTRALNDHHRRRAVAREPGPLLARAVDAGLLDALAPAWLVVARRSADASHDVDLDLPSFVDAEAPSRWQVVTVAGPQGLVPRWADDADTGDHERSEGPLSRTLELTADHGHLFELDLEQACASRDHRAIRAQVRRYAAWLDDESAWTQRGQQRFFATPGNVLVDDGGELQLVDGTWRLAGCDDGQEALVRGLRDFARGLLARAGVHPWRSTSTPDELATSLAAMAGVTVTAELLSSAARYEAQVAALLAGRPEQVDEVTEENVQDGRHGRSLPARDAVGFRELLAHDRAQARRLREQQEQIAWLEGTLRHRDRYIRTLERLIERYEETLTYRAVQAMRAPRRVATAMAVSTAKQTAADVLPPDGVAKARRLAARLLNQGR